MSGVQLAYFTASAVSASITRIASGSHRCFDRGGSLLPVFPSCAPIVLVTFNACLPTYQPKLENKQMHFTSLLLVQRCPLIHATYRELVYEHARRIPAGGSLSAKSVLTLDDFLLMTGNYDWKGCHSDWGKIPRIPIIMSEIFLQQRYCCIDSLCLRVAQGASGFSLAAGQYSASPTTFTRAIPGLAAGAVELTIIKMRVAEPFLDSCGIRTHIRSRGD